MTPDEIAAIEAGARQSLGDPHEHVRLAAAHVLVLVRSVRELQAREAAQAPLRAALATNDCAALHAALAGFAGAR